LFTFRVSNLYGFPSVFERTLKQSFNRSIIVPFILRQLNIQRWALHLAIGLRVVEVGPSSLNCPWWM